MGKYYQSNKKNSNWQRNALMVLCAVLALVLFVLIFATAYVNYLLGRLNRVDPNNESSLSLSEAIDILHTDPDVFTLDPNSTETYVDIGDVTFPTNITEPVDHGDHVINILLVGQDRREYETGRTRSDSMILVTFNTEKNTITLTSFMRDQYVRIPGYLPNKLNAAYAFGGMNLLNETLLANFGVVVDGDVEVDFSGFEKVINLLGGVEITLTQKEADHLNDWYGYNLKAGTQRLDGEKALSYARIRKLDTDYKRTERQRTVIMSLIKEFKNQPLTKILSLMDDILPLVTTNMSNSEILSYTRQLFPMLATAQINSQRIPVDGTFEEGTVHMREGFYGWCQYNIDFEANREFLRRIFGTN